MAKIFGWLFNLFYMAFGHVNQWVHLAYLLVMGVMSIWYPAILVPAIFAAILYAIMWTMWRVSFGK